MPKTLPPGILTVPGVDAPIVANAVPDPFDDRDLPYRPRLEPLPPVLDRRSTEHFVFLQEGNSCTGHAVACVVNTVLARAIRAVAHPTNGAAEPAADTAQLPRVSPYMLYRLARRYDEFEGDEDAGSSLRGVFKGWFHHGVALWDNWPKLTMEPEPDLDDPTFMDLCRDRPLGAFYRVNPFRLDDMQSAISELNAIAVSAVIHDGWLAPEVIEKDGQTLHVIRRNVDSKGLGGHAFALVGYNEVGFLVQNSWGTTWGKGGFATLPYEDWLDSAYDAWVARPGVPKTPFASGRTSTAIATGREFATGPGPDLRRLAMHVINLGNDGLLSTQGKFTSTPAQIDRIFNHMQSWHDHWTANSTTRKRHIVIYAHGGLVNESGGLKTAQKHLDWWLNNHVYPVNFAWQSGPAETMLSQLVDVTKGRLPFGGLGFDLVEQFDRLIEKIARSNFRWMWDQMKQNARAASAPIADAGAVNWGQPSAHAAMQHMPGASLTVLRLAEYVKQHGADQVAIHLVGHSAGAIFLAALIQQLAAAKLTAESMTWLAPAIRVDEFCRDVLPQLGPRNTVRRFATFAMTDQRELDDVCGVGGINVYNKSLLYLVSRALEQPGNGNPFEAPLLGMHKFFAQPTPSDRQRTLLDAIKQAGGVAVFSRSATPDDQRSDAVAHGAFDDDRMTMTSVLMQMLGVRVAKPEYDYQANAAPIGTRPSMAADRPVIIGVVGATADSGATAPLRAAAPLTPPVETHAPGSTPLVETAQPQTTQPQAPQQPEPLLREVAVAPRSGSPILDVLQAQGWQIVPRTADGDMHATTDQPMTTTVKARKPSKRKKATSKS